MVRCIRLRYDWLSDQDILTEEIIKRRVREPVTAWMRDSIAPLLDEIAREKAGAVKIAKVNLDDNQSLSFKYNIRAIPALLFFKNGQLRDQVIGVTSKKDLLSGLEALA
jgi:thioredoxin-like negative regulator of GroEL